MIKLNAWDGLSMVFFFLVVLVYSRFLVTFVFQIHYMTKSKMLGHVGSLIGNKHTTTNVGETPQFDTEENSVDESTHWLRGPLRKQTQTITNTC